MSFFGSSRRSTWVRLVLSSAAILSLEIFCFFMASASCHATTSVSVRLTQDQERVAERLDQAGAILRAGWWLGLTDLFQAQ
jgi:hypothetical protein